MLSGILHKQILPKCTILIWLRNMRLEGRRCHASQFHLVRIHFKGDRFCGVKEIIY
jgi:hypothetical protein